MAGRFLPLEQAHTVAVGRTPTDVPQPLIDVLEGTYRRGQMYELPLKADEDPDELLRLAKIYARRRGLTIQHTELEDETGTLVGLHFRMKDKRTYTRREN